MSDATTTSRARQGLESAPCPLTAFLTFAFIGAGILSVALIVGLAVWLPIEIKQGSETIKEQNDIHFKANVKGDL